MKRPRSRSTRGALTSAKRVPPPSPEQRKSREQDNELQPAPVAVVTTPVQVPVQADVTATPAQSGPSPQEENRTPGSVLKQREAEGEPFLPVLRNSANVMRTPRSRSVGPRTFAKKVPPPSTEHQKSDEQNNELQPARVVAPAVQVPVAVDVPATPVQSGPSSQEENRTPGSILKRQGDLFSPRTNSARRVHFDCWNGDDEPKQRFVSASTPYPVRKTRARQSLIASYEVLEAKRLHTNSENVPTDGSPENTPKKEHFSLDRDFKHIYPQLMDCTRSAADLLKAINEPSARMGERVFLTGKKIKTIGDLARLSRSEISKLPFVTPKIQTLKEKLDSIMKEVKLPLTERQLPPFLSIKKEAPEEHRADENDVDLCEFPATDSASPARPASADLFEPSPDLAEENMGVDVQEEQQDEVPVKQEDEDVFGPVEASVAPKPGSSSPEAEPAHTESESKPETGESALVSPESRLSETFGGMKLVGPVWSASLQAVQSICGEALPADEINTFLSTAREEIAKESGESLGQMTYDELVTARRATRDALASFAHLLDDEFQKYERKFFRQD